MAALAAWPVLYALCTAAPNDGSVIRYDGRLRVTMIPDDEEESDERSVGRIEAMLGLLPLFLGVCLAGFVLQWIDLSPALSVDLALWGAMSLYLYAALGAVNNVEVEVDRWE